MVFFFGILDHNFFIFNLFSTILSVLDAPIKGLELLFRHQKQRALPGPIDPITIVASNVQLI
jgi:hypothetical protein